MVLNISEIINKISKSILVVLGLCIIVLSISCDDIELVDKPNTKVDVELPSLDDNGSNSYTVVINGQTIIIGGGGSLPELFPGVYPILVYSNNPSVTVLDGIAQVGLINGQLNSYPDLFFSKSGEISLESNSYDNTKIELEQQIRQLEIAIRPPSGGAYDHISTIEGKFTGVTGRWDLIKNTAVGPGMEVPVKFIKQDDGTWSAKLRLLGLFGEKQELIGEIRFLENSNQPRLKASSLQTNQQEQILPFQSDLTEFIKDFNREKSIPFSLNGVIELPTESGFVVSIKDWERQNEAGTAW
ncbi:FimB/Mfa2 family fimbrial subunit [Sphingobacterium bovistauri]|uniref:DUF5689 domain-containing protein n=1 Tax=Sphingobacterium bovistauri TaxID=2781959 RepID=A0ABS7Z8D9_9SPHI|nr:FimB/Mfa2 family fimbrial subunit [Sphingobacterium bovistauri]MCA5006258.1 hypothetical protein [Sphingobacterium bovistauri]